eukprot:533772-Pelagomonas_calceolata.AAC.14
MWLPIRPTQNLQALLSHLKSQTIKLDIPDAYLEVHVSHNGMDPMMMRLMDESSLLLAQTDEVTLEAGLGSPRIDYIWNVAWHALVGRQQDMIEFYSRQAFEDFAQAQVPRVRVRV